MAQMPDIKPEVNKEPEKKPGFLAGLFGGGGGGSGAAGLGGLGGSAAGGGLLATKTGLLALILVGTTVAGGIGLVGYKVFGPGDSDQPSQNIQLFAAKPKDAAPNPNAAPAAKDGNSASLEGFAKANSGALKGETPAGAEAPKEEASAAGAASAGSAAPAGSPNAVAGSSGNGASKSMLKNAKKMGALSTSFGGGAGSAPSAGASKAGAGDSLAMAAKAGQSGAMTNTKRGAAVASNARGVGGRARRMSAKGQALAARDLGRQNQTSMQGAGRGFENSAANAGGETIGDPNAISMGGAGAGEGAPSRNFPKPMVGDTKEVKPPEPPKTYDVTPYAKEMQMAQMLVLLAAGLLYYASTLAKTPGALSGMPQMLCYAAMALGLLVTAIGLKISGGEYGQKTQGMILAAAGAGIAAAAAMAAFGKVPAKGGFGNLTTIMLLGGGGAALALVGTMLAKPKTCQSTVAGDAGHCTSMIERSSRSPSERALERYLT